MAPANPHLPFSGVWSSFQNRTDLFWTVGEQDGGFLFWFRLGGQDRVVPAGVEAQDDFGAWWVLDADTL